MAKHINVLNQEIQNLKNLNNQLQHQMIEYNASVKTKKDYYKDEIASLMQSNHLNTLQSHIFFNETLNKAIHHSNRHKKILAMLSINIDSFKTIISSYGREAADEILRVMTDRFLKVLRTEDILKKFEEDEFIVLLTDIGKPKFASTVAEKLLRACKQPLKMNDKEFFLTLSIGICIYPGDGESLEELLEHGNLVLDTVKQAGGNNYQFYTNEMDIEAREYIKLGQALRQAIENNQLVLYFQPKLHLKQGDIIGVECLIRWFHPEFGAIEPSKFIKLAEETGLILTLGEWVLYEACKINKYWQDEGFEHMTIGINLSHKQFYHPDIVKAISKALIATGLNPNYLELEITETTVMDDIELASRILNEIKAIGVKITIDHFGTGYTSITHLKKLPVSTLKIDQSFIKGIPYNLDDLAITNAFIALAHHLGLQIVAEGVETAEQVQYLAAQNCDMIQGYFLSYPLSAQKITSQFKKLMDNVLL